MYLALQAAIAAQNWYAGVIWGKKTAGAIVPTAEYLLIIFSYSSRQGALVIAP